MLPVIIRGAAAAGTRAGTAKKVASSTTTAAQSKKEVDTARGIQNAEARFQKRTHDRLTSTQLQYGSRERFMGTERHAGTSKNTRETLRRSQRNELTTGFEAANSKNQKQTVQNIRSLFKDEDHPISDSEIQNLSELKTEHIDKPSFPYLIFAVAVLKDIVDVVATLSIIGVPFAFALSFPMSLILFIWVMGKMSGGWWKKMLIRGILVRLGITIGIEFIPGVNIIPTTTVFILMTHYREKKVVKLLNSGLELMHSSGLK